MSALVTVAVAIVTVVVAAMTMARIAVAAIAVVVAVVVATVAAMMTIVVMRGNQGRNADGKCNADGGVVAVIMPVVVPLTR